MRRVLPLKGAKSLKALNAFSALLFARKCMPPYVGEDYPTFLESFRGKTDAEKEAVLREAVTFAKLETEEVEALVSFATDPNGVPYGETNQKNLTVDELFEVVVSVCMEIGRIKIDLVSEAEKKN